MLRCLIVDDSLRFRQAARSLLEREGIAVVGLVSTGAEALRLTKEVRPDVTLVDIDLGGQSGFDVARLLHREAGLDPSQLILISTHSGDDYADLISASPVAGFLSKTTLCAAGIRDLLGLRNAGDTGADR
jgi:DNA-binding NarL/FixJ family response regulator